MSYKDFVEIAKSANVRSDSHSFALFAHKCWPEILAVVEAVKNGQWDRINAALDALDKKAREVEGN